MYVVSETRHVILEYHHIATEIFAAFCVKYDPKKSEFFQFQKTENSLHLLKQYYAFLVNSRGNEDCVYCKDD